MEDKYVSLVMENAELLEENTDLKYKYEKEHRKRLKEKGEMYNRNQVSRKIAIASTAIFSAISIAAGAALASFVGSMNKINYGKKELVNIVQTECLYGISCRDDSVAGLIFSIGSEQVSFDSAMNAIKHRAYAAGLSDLDLYIGISKIYGKRLATTLVPDVNPEDIDQRCMEIYLEQELERIRANGK